MECEHCAYSCTSKGVDMPRRVFVKACELAEDMGGYITIGGGEPTLHPRLFDYIGIAGAYTDEGVPFLVTNGKITDLALRLASMAHRGLVGVDLSLDYYHEVIDECVEAAFRRAPGNRDDRDMRNIRDVTHGGQSDPIPQGRAENWALGDVDACVCDDLLVTPDGRLFSCGCMSIQYGTIFDPTLPDEYPEEWCAKAQAREREECLS